METKTIDLKPVFTGSSKLFIQSIKKCFKLLNTLLKEKSEVFYNPLFLRVKSNEIHVGYKPISDDIQLFSDIFLDPSYELITKVAIVQLVILNVCKEYDCIKYIKMHGVPEVGTETYFKFILDDTEYTYKLWYS